MGDGARLVGDELADIGQFVGETEIEEGRADETHQDASDK